MSRDTRITIACLAAAVALLWLAWARYRRSGHDHYRVRDKGDGRAQERLDAAEAKRAHRRERNLRNQRSQQYGGFW